MRVVYQNNVKSKKFFPSRKINRNWRGQAYSALDGLVSVGEAFSASRYGRAVSRTKKFFDTTIPRFYDELTRDDDALKSNPISQERWINEVRKFRNEVKDTYSFGVMIEVISRIASFLTQMKKVWVGPYGIRAVVFDKPRKRVLDSIMHDVDLTQAKAKIFNIDLDAMPGTQRDKFIELMSATDHLALKEHELPLELRRALNRANKVGSTIILTSNSPSSRAICEANMKKLSSKVWINANNGAFLAGPTQDGRMQIVRDERLEKGLIEDALRIAKPEQGEHLFNTEVNVCLTDNNGNSVDAVAKLKWDVSIVDHYGVEHVIALDELDGEIPFDDNNKECQSLIFKPRIDNMLELIAKKGALLWQSELDDIHFQSSYAGCTAFIFSKIDKHISLTDVSLQPRSDGGFSVLKGGLYSMNSVDEISNLLREDVCSIVGTTEALCEPVGLENSETVFMTYKRNKQKNSKQLVNDRYMWSLFQQANKIPAELLTKENQSDKLCVIDNKRLCLTGNCGVAKKKLGVSIFNLIFGSNGGKVKKSLEKKTGDSFAISNVVKDGVKFVTKSLTSEK